MDEQDQKTGLGLPRRIAKRTWRCLNESDLAAYVDKGLCGRKLARVQAHLAVCPYCLNEVASLVRLEDTPLPDAVPARLLALARGFVDPKKKSFVKSVWPLGAAVAATACLALVTTFWVGQPHIEVQGSRTATRMVRKAPDQRARPELLSPREGAVVAPASLDIHWTGISQSLYYEIRVLTADGDVLWDGRANTTQIRLPENVRLDSGQKYYVSVNAWLPEGRSIKSPVVGFQTAGK